MNDALRSEWIKAVTLRGYRAAVIGTVILTAGILVAVARFAGAGNAMAVFDAANMLTLLVAFVLGGLGSAIIAGEHGHNTIRATYTLTPRRGRVLLAKTVLTVTGSATVAAVTLVAIPLGVHHVIRPMIGTSPDMAIPGLDQRLAAPVVVCVLIALCGLALGMVTRSTTLSCLTLVLWPLLVEPLIGLVLAFNGSSSAEMLPFSKLIEAFITSDNAAGDARLAAAGYFALWTAVIGGLGWVRQLRRDV